MIRSAPVSPMKCVTWNVRGLRNPCRRGVVGQNLWEWGADVVCLQETLLANPDLQTWSSLGWGRDMAHVHINATGRSGGVLFAWKETRFALQTAWRGQHVAAACLTSWADDRHIVFASVYGPSISTSQGELWEDMIQMCETFPNHPVLIRGDFNVTLEAEDRSNGIGGRDPGSVQFRKTLLRLCLIEMGPSDRRFTWRGPSLQSRINRFLCSPSLADAFPLAEVSSLPRTLSDHSPLVWVAQAGIARPTYFKMDRSWTREPGFKEGIEQWWSSRIIYGTSSSRLATKLTDFRRHLFELHRQICNDRTHRRDVALARIQALDEMEDSGPLWLSEAQERRSCQDEVAEMDLRCEMDWRQRSRQMWLAAGDASTRFFHQFANGRRRQNQIKCLRVGDRNFRDQASVGQAHVAHFRDFYRQGPRNRWQWTLTIASTLPLLLQQQLIRPFSLEEVKAAVWGLNSEGAPGPDGIPIFFYKECWNVVGPEVMAVLKEFRGNRCHMERLNRAYLVLIPKTAGAENIGDFRPISLSNSIYLIITKVPANRLRGTLESLISPLQSAFLLGRQMMDNVVIAQEIVADWCWSGTVGFMWKVDFAKAYDSLDWQFLWNVLRRRGFPEEWIRWMKLCITTISFSVLVNGRPQGGRVQPQRGIWQGCPLAPLLFILAVDTLAFCTAKLCSTGLLSGYPVTGFPRRCSTAAVRRRYHLLHSRLRVGGPHPMHHDGNFLQFLRSPSKQSQIHFRGIRVTDGRDDPLCGHSGGADPHAPHTVLGYSIV